MRTAKDRLRHTLLFETFGLTCSIPLGCVVLGRSPLDIGPLAVFLSMAAMTCNYVYNLLFDLALVRLGRSLSHRPPVLRVLHAVLFELSFLVLTIPVVAWWLNMTLWAAFLADLFFVAFFLVYAYLFNWGYDRVFPMSEAMENTRG